MSYIGQACNLVNTDLWDTECRKKLINSEWRSLWGNLSHKHDTLTIILLQVLMLQPEQNIFPIKLNPFVQGG
jgi:hypothetical protein